MNHALSVTEGVGPQSMSKPPETMKLEEDFGLRFIMGSPTTFPLGRVVQCGCA